MEKSAYTRLRQSEQENYQQWIIEFQLRILQQGLRIYQNRETTNRKGEKSI